MFGYELSGCGFVAVTQAKVTFHTKINEKPITKSFYLKKNDKQRSFSNDININRSITK